MMIDIDLSVGSSDDIEDELRAEIERLKADNRSYETALANYADKVEQLELEVAAWKQASDLKAAEIERLRTGK